MLINNIIKKALADISCPVAFMKYKGESDNFIVFATTGQTDVKWCDDKTYINTRASLNYYYKTEKHMQLIEEIEKKLKENGFEIVTTYDVSSTSDDMYNRSYYLKYQKFEEEL